MDASSPKDTGTGKTGDLLDFGFGRRMKVIMQAELAECGLACLAMVSGHFGYQVDMNTMRSRFPLSNRGSRLSSLIEISDQLGFSSRALKLEITELHLLQCPCILHWDLNHFVVLSKCKKRYADVLDPALGERRLSIEEVSKHFTGIALELYPTSAFSTGSEERPLKLSQFWSRMVGLKRSFTQILILSLLLQLFAVVAPFYLQTVVDDVLLRKDTDLLVVLAIGFALLACIETLTGAIRQYLLLNLSSRLDIQMSANLFRHLLRLPLDFFERRHLGDIVSKFGSLDSVRTILSSTLVTALVDGLMTAITLIAMLVYSLKLTLVVVLFLLTYVAVRSILYKPIHRLTEESLTAHAKTHSSFMESVQAIQTIKIFERETQRQIRWQNLHANSLNKDIGLARLNIGFDTFSLLTYGIENVIVVYLAAYLVLEGNLSIGMLYAFIAYKNRFVQSVDTLVDKIVELKTLRVHLDRISDIALSDQDSANSFQTSDATCELSGGISVHKLEYEYSGCDSPIFTGISFVVLPGESVAITGPSGCGKSTLLKCMMGIYTPSRGSVLVDGIDVTKAPNYRRSVAGVMQDDDLLSGSIAENITCFDESPDTSWMKECAKLAHIAQEIEQFPMSYDTPLGDLGTGLSGGQKQRLLIARAFYRRPQIIFMDEATSHLDLEAENIISSNIRDMRITRVIVAHRPETIAAADRELKLVYEDASLRHSEHTVGI